MAINKKTREQVYLKYGGHCAYCGREIAMKDMQVDHFIPKRGWNESGSDDLANLMPACRMCNHYKRAHSLETFRTYIEEIPKKLRENYIYKIGVVYGNVIENEKQIQFYFEKANQPNNSRIVMSDEDCADCLCRVCARNRDNDSYNRLCNDKECGCECEIGKSYLVITPDDCKDFLEDEDR